MTWLAYVVDDEPLAVKRLVRLLESTQRVTIAGATTSPAAAAEYLASHQIDVLFLDIDMPGHNGFELLSRLQHPPCVVFTTAHHTFALKAFEVNSIDYLLKPIDPAHLTRALDKLERLRSTPLGRADVARAIEQVTAAISTRPSTPERLASRLGNRVCFIEVSAVTHFTADEKITYAIANGKRYCIDAALADLEQRLDPARFIRIHRATIVNTHWVAELLVEPGEDVMIRLNNPERTTLLVAKSRVSQVKEHLGV